MNLIIQIFILIAVSCKLLRKLFSSHKEFESEANHIKISTITCTDAHDK